MVGPDARFRVASLSKPIIAATVLRLVERGQIKLDAPVERYLPKVVRGKGAGAAIDGRKITVRDLLRQTKGNLRSGPKFSRTLECTRNECQK